ncbi:MAG: SPOR domain-containing protein [Bacteroidia bacterium]|nr:SPOR domain-containing protein [Bacteroidia bacterium]MBT8278575.1 SPOR domain-containing protein [Bacteroidia bacterium]NND25005.1 SPOR domain-containing protein [Flavobacteriaceae bacterium]NNK59531.1 SPOR domain-containing protein [Flavobacteriaceae bacterium]NNL32601.1 SPOR domain-containing protein [Flavobacteriaceae bacterium]
MKISLTFLALIFSFFTTTILAQEGTVNINQNSEIDKLLELKKDVNAKEKNYRIQIYNGSRSGAENASENFRMNYSGWTVSMQYETPNYKIWVGNFKTRLEADRALLRVKRKFTNAFIFKPKKD